MCEDAKEQLEVESKLRTKLERDVKDYTKGRKLISSRPKSTPLRRCRPTARGMSVFISFSSLVTLLTVVLGCKLG